MQIKVNAQLILAIFKNKSFKYRWKKCHYIFVIRISDVSEEFLGDSLSSINQIL